MPTKAQAQKTSWRDVLPVHEAADLFPMMSDAELVELGKDIEARGRIIEPIQIWDGDDGPSLLDGRNRLDAAERAGLLVIKDESESDQRFFLKRADGSLSPIHERHCELLNGPLHQDPYALVISLNIRRRHLTADQKLDLIAKLIDANPEKSDRQIAEQTKASPTTVGKARQLSKRGQLTAKRVGKDGKARTAKPQPKRRTAEDAYDEKRARKKQLQGTYELTRAGMDQLSADLEADRAEQQQAEPAASATSPAPAPTTTPAASSPALVPDVKGDETAELGALLAAWDHARESAREKFLRRVGLHRAERTTAGDLDDLPDFLDRR